jgi:RNAse (barnase) inhibitor barstar
MASLASLLQRGRSGVYWLVAPRDLAEVEHLAAGAGRSFFRVECKLIRGKGALLDRLARALRFPDWFGRNWDALEECLTDLSWLEAKGVVVLLDGADAFAEAAPEDFASGLEVLRSAAGFWKGKRRPMLVLLRGERRPPALEAVVG